MDTITLVVIILIVVLILHLIEEVRAEFRKKLPLGEMPLPVFVGLNILIYSFCLANCLLVLTENPLGIYFSWIFAVGMLLNSLGHLGFTLIRRSYFPGAITSVPMLPLAICLLVLLAGY
jgi:hypothetical protein